MAPNDPRMVSTISAIYESPGHNGLLSDSLVYVTHHNCALMDCLGEEGTSTGVWLASQIV